MVGKGSGRLQSSESAAREEAIISALRDAVSPLTVREIASIINANSPIHWFDDAVRRLERIGIVRRADKVEKHFGFVTKIAKDRYHHRHARKDVQRWALVPDSKKQDHSVAEQEDKGVEVTVTITGRMGGVPTDRKGKVISTMSATGKDYLNLYLIDLAEYIAIDDPKVIHANYEDVMNVANSLIIGTEEYSAAHGNIPPVTTNGFVEPLQLLGYGPVVEQPASWIRSENSKPGDIMSIEVRFGLARRLTVSDSED